MRSECGLITISHCLERHKRRWKWRTWKCNTSRKIARNESTV